VKSLEQIVKDNLEKKKKLEAERKVANQNTFGSYKIKGKA
jgi:hypothetical protein